MKKCVVLLICFTMILCGCQNSNNTAQTATEATAEPKKIGMDFDDSIPTAVKNLYLRYDRIIKRDSLNLELRSLPRLDKQLERTYIFSFSDKNKDSYSYIMYISTTKTGLIRDTTVMINLDADYNIISEFIKASFVVFDMDMTAEEAQSKLQELFGTYKGKYSEKYEVNGYLFYLSKAQSEKFRIVSKERMWNADINKEEYAPIDYVSYLTIPKNYGNTYMLEGTVTKFEHDLDLVRGYAVMTVRGTDGRIYMVSYMYELYPVEFQVGEKFRFYGLLIQGYDYQPELDISYYEKIDE